MLGIGLSLKNVRGAIQAVRVLFIPSGYDRLLLAGTGDVFKVKEA